MTWIPVWESGFETQDPTELVLDSSGQNPGQGLSFSSAFPRTGQFARTLNQSNGQQPDLGKVFADAFTRFRIGFAYRYAGLASDTNVTRRNYLFNVGPRNASRLSLDFAISISALNVLVNGALVESIPVSSLGLAVGNYYDIGIQGNLVNDSNGFVTVYIDGNQIFTFSGAITGGPANSFYGGGTNHVGVVWPQGNMIDDMYLDVADGAEPDVAPPTYRIGYTTVNGAGDSSQWTAVGAASNWDTVNDGVPDGDTTHVSAAAADLLDLYTVAGITVPEGYSPVGVRPIYTARKTDSATDSRLASVIKDGATQAVGATEQILPADYASILGDYHAERPGGGNWTEAAINALQIGQMSKGAF